MGTIIYGRFADQVFRDQIETIRWNEIPIKLRTWAVLWRDGENIRNQMSKSAYYRARKALLEDHGIDIGVPCNVQALTHKVQTVTVRPVSALREAA